ncbi:hypothetical protein [Polyangium sp. y55x31]|uniref:hypothetical protein n=1 Tax=Polyangium sp. y55x31 TaxID=3042688 RepID=UPI0024823637|nr:hypothetical protein [Polyangium sp. y55x31]MDI1476860.1 hypothetical protein [Polyangium sp. y55x31]
MPADNGLLTHARQKLRSFGGYTAWKCRMKNTSMQPQFSQELRSAIEERIRRYPALSEAYTDFGEEVRKFNALPIGFDMDTIFFVKPNGEILAWDLPSDEPRPVTSLWLQLVLLRLGAIHFPELIEALPRRPDGAPSCSACGGRGFVDNRSPMGGGSADWPCWPCGTMGWHDGEPLYP